MEESALLVSTSDLNEDNHDDDGVIVLGDSSTFSLPGNSMEASAVSLPEKQVSEGSEKKAHDYSSDEQLPITSHIINEQQKVINKRGYFGNSEEENEDEKRDEPFEEKPHVEDLGVPTQKVIEEAGRKRIKEENPQPKDRDEPRSEEINGADETAAFTQGVPSDFGLRRRRPQLPLRQQQDEMERPGALEKKGIPCSTVLKWLLVVLAFFILVVLFLPILSSPQKPVVKIKTAKHVSPTASSWQLQGSCRGYNLSYFITQCHWKQIHPKPTNADNTLFAEGTQDCLRGNPSHNIDATLQSLGIPEELGNYIFELHCTDQNGNTNYEQVDIWINVLTPPKIKVLEKTVVCTYGSAQLYASCQAVQGKVVSEKWEFVDGPKELDHPARDGIINEIDVPGKYEYKFKCLDSYGGVSSAKVNVIAKPPYVIGIDLGPVVEIKTAKYVSPTASSWQLQGSCRGYNVDYIITQCHWKQIHPKPTNADNTLFAEGTQDCLHGNPSHNIDATLRSLRITKQLGNYIFELHCTDQNGNTNYEHVDVWIKELVPPVIKVDEENIVLSTSVGSTQLRASCQAIQGKVAIERWEFIDGPVRDLDHPARDGTVKIDVPGKYEFKFVCSDSYGGVSNAKVNIIAKPSIFLSPQKPVVEIKTAKHVSPTASSWQLQGSCRGYNSSYTITECQWKQIHPKPTKFNNTLFADGTQDCLHGNPSHKIDATLRSLRIPEELGSYIFELQCTDNTGNTGDERVDVWINELVPPVIKVGEENIVVSTSVGSTQLMASCQAIQGKVAIERWELIDGPVRDLDHPARDGTVKISDVPGKYEFKFVCSDSYGGVSNAKVNIIAKPSIFLSPQKPVVEIKTAKHVSPTASSWQLQGSCHGYNSSYTITQCQWKQIHPKPTKFNNTLFANGTQDCLHGNPSHKIDATLRSLRIPKELGNYIFELQCTDNTGNTGDERVDVWIKELVPPVIKVDEENIVLSTSVGSTRLRASCQAIQGKVAIERWELIDGPVRDLDHPAKDGTIKIDVPGKYEFKFKCSDSYDGLSSATVNVIAKPPYVLGIDLGTSTTCIVVIKEDGTTQDINIYHNGNDTDPCMPSVVAFAKSGELLIGEEALHQAVTNPFATIYEVKRLMGRSYYDDPSHKFSYKVRPTLASYSLKGVRAAIEIPCDGENKLLQPELVSALILRRAADVAEKYLQVPVKDVVISVPAQFDDAQRKATKDAGHIAGLSPIKIVNEPTVAAFAAKHVMEDWSNSNPQDPSVKKEQSTVWAVVADIGGGTTDYALMQIESSKNRYKVITTDGNKILGGRDIDIAVAKKLTEILQNKHSELNMNSVEFQQQLRIECEHAKIALSENDQYWMTVVYSDEKHVKLPLRHLLTRDTFEDYISEILEEMLAPLDSLLTRAKGISRNIIEELYLVGGTSNIPKLKEMLQKYFSKVKKVLHKDPVQLVSRGAAAFGAALTHLVEIQNMPEIDVTPLPISIAVDMNDTYEIFPRNTLYPALTIKNVTTFTNEQTSIVVKVYEGEGRTANENHFLGELELSGIPPQPKGIPRIETTYIINANGILSVTAAHAGEEIRKNLEVYTKSGSMMEKTKEKLSSLLWQLLKSNYLSQQSKCSLLETTTEMKSILRKPEKENMLKLYVDSKYASVEMASHQNPNAIGMIAIKGLVTNSETATKSPDMDIVLVIDKSSSMSGLPIETIRNVILRFIDVLKGNHRLGIVTYDSIAMTLLELTDCTDENTNRARDIVKRIAAGGVTNLYGGLLRGLEMAYGGERRSRVLLFTDGRANVGWTDTEDIIREISSEMDKLKSFTSAEVQLSTFGYLGDHDEVLLRKLASNGGTYNYLDENTKLAVGFGLVLADAINTIAERIQLTVTPLNGVQLMNVIAEFCKKDQEKITCEIPSLADQHSLHILLDLSVPPCEEEKAHDVLFHVDLKYTNTIMNHGEGSEERLFVARTKKLDKETRSREVDEQLNRVFVANKIGKSLDHLNKHDKKQSTRMLKEADESIMASISRDSTLSLCLHRDLVELIGFVERGDLNEAKKALQDSLTSHMQEKGGRKTCYLTRKEDQLITILQN